MNTLKIIAWTFVVLYALLILLLYTLQSKLIFYPGKLHSNFKFRLGAQGEEVMLKTVDGESISGLFFPGPGADVILYFHGNAGDLSGWQFVEEDFTSLGFNFMIIDYRGYGKSSGTISEKGMYYDGEAAYDFLVRKGFASKNILIYGRSVGSGVAVNLAVSRPSKGLVLESPFSSLNKLANEKLPFFFPSLYLRFRFDNIGKIGKVRVPVIILHGSADTLIPASHSAALFEHCSGKKEMMLVEGGGHNDLHTFKQYAQFIGEMLPVFF